MVGKINSHCRLATCPLTGGKKPGGERIPHPHQLLLRKAIKQ